MKAETNENQPDRSNPRARALLHAAEEILLDEGPTALSARAIASRAKVNKGLLFYYWGSTDTLFAEVLERYYERHKLALAEAFSGGGELTDRMRDVIDAYLDFMESNLAYARIVQQQVSANGPHAALVKKHLGQVLALTTNLLAPITEPSGPLSARHFHLSLSAAVVNYFTYAQVLGAEHWGTDPFSAPALAERREHIHWIVKAWLSALQAERRGPSDSS